MSKFDVIKKIYKMKLVKENINEGVVSSETVMYAKMDTLEYLRDKIFTTLDEDELVEYLKTMREWFDSNIY
jgi:hypothetical protein